MPMKPRPAPAPQRGVSKPPEAVPTQPEASETPTEAQEAPVPEPHKPDGRIAAQRRNPTGPTSPLAPSEMDIVRAMWFGDPGLGKTTAMLTLANIGTVGFLDAEQRMKRSALKRAGVNVDNIERITDVSYANVNTKLDEWSDRADSDPTFVGICYDGGTEGTRVMTADLVDAGVATAARKGFERSEWKTYQDDYGDLAEQFRRLLRKALRIPVHFGMTCLAKRDKDENDRIRVAPQLTPAVWRDVNAAMDIVTFLRVDVIGDEVLRSGMCQPGGPFEAKDTFGVLPRRLANPTFERILRYVNEEYETVDDPQQDDAIALLQQAAAETAAKSKDKAE